MYVSVILTCCYEGRLLARALQSARQSVAASGFPGHCEIVLVADAADRGTRLVIEEEGNGLPFLQTDFRDLGRARNEAATIARGELLLFQDADDLWYSNWVGAAWTLSKEAGPQSVLHPEKAALFGARNEILSHMDWRMPQFDPRGLVARNYWISACGVHRDLLREHPFPAVQSENRFGFEDWSWYAALTACGVRHVVVPDTMHFVRVKAGSSMQLRMHGSFPVPSPTFADYLAADDPTRPYDL